MFGLRTGILVVDMQADFTEYRNGSLAVPGTGESYVEAVNRAVGELHGSGFPLFATRDWHPVNHISFFTNHEGSQPFQQVTLADGRTQTLWPPHCVQDTPGAGLLVDETLFTHIFGKGTDPRFDSYSAFQDDRGAVTELDKVLRAEKIGTLVVFGLATDYCVRATVLHGVKRGYRVVLMSDLCRGVAPETSRAALTEMAAAGAHVMEIYSLQTVQQIF